MHQHLPPFLCAIIGQVLHALFSVCIRPTSFATTYSGNEGLERATMLIETISWTNDICYLLIMSGPSWAHSLGVRGEMSLFTCDWSDLDSRPDGWMSESTDPPPVPLPLIVAILQIVATLWIISRTITLKHSSNGLCSGKCYSCSCMYTNQEHYVIIWIFPFIQHNGYWSIISMDYTNIYVIPNQVIKSYDTITEHG